MSNHWLEKVSEEQVFELLADGNWRTYAELANRFDVSPATIQKKVRSLIQSGYLILKGPRGVRLVDDSMEIDAETAAEVMDMMAWVFATVASMAHHAVPVKSLMPSIKRALPKTKDERLFLRQLMVRMTHLIDWESIDDMDMAG